MIHFTKPGGKHIPNSIPWGGIYAKRMQTQSSSRKECRSALETPKPMTITVPFLKEMLEVFVVGARKSVYVHEVSPADLEELILKITANSGLENDLLYQRCKLYMDRKTNSVHDIVAICGSICYRAGCVGLKLSNDHPFIYSHIDEPLVSHNIITPSTRIRLQPMLYGAYRIEE